MHLLRRALSKIGSRSGCEGAVRNQALRHCRWGPHRLVGGTGKTPSCIPKQRPSLPLLRPRDTGEHAAERKGDGTEDGHDRVDDGAGSTTRAYHHLLEDGTTRNVGVYDGQVVRKALRPVSLTSEGRGKGATLP